MDSEKYKAKYAEKLADLARQRKEMIQFDAPLGSVRNYTRVHLHRMPEFSGLAKAERIAVEQFVNDQSHLTAVEIGLKQRVVEYASRITEANQQAYIDARNHTFMQYQALLLAPPGAMFSNPNGITAGFDEKLQGTIYDQMNADQRSEMYRYFFAHGMAWHFDEGVQEI